MCWRGKRAEVCILIFKLPLPPRSGLGTGGGGGLLYRMRFSCRTVSAAMAFSLSLMALPAHAVRRIIDCDLCIYGATSGGVAAAVQGVRHGLKVVLLDPGNHIGGMTSGGLGATDKGNTDSIGGLSSDFYLRIGRKYTPNTNVRKYLFEPKIASAVFQDWLTAAAVTPLLNEPLTAVKKIGTVIREIETGTGLVVRAGMFIDTTYEGDLLAAAGVTFRVGREANATHGETKNGVLTPTISPFVNLTVDPYPTPGNPASGLITGISAGAPATPGSADSLVQAYNFRLCLTQAANRLPLAPPLNYQATDYEMIGRYLAAKAASGGPVDLASFNDGIFHNIGTADGFPGGKSDWNANKGMSSDWVGHSHEWPTAAYARRREIAGEHENYIRGIFQFLRTDPRVPANIKNEVATWGLPPDEFVNHGNWSPQLYVREARRMVGDYMLTEANGRSTVTAPRSIALASYAMDSHYCQRVVVSGKTHAEGGFFELPPKPWPIGLGAITPKPTECTNLLATFALSATHVAFSSARMEPVFMMTSHSAATAAAVALRKHQNIQDVSYPELSALLRSDGQILGWASTTSANGIVVEAEGPGGSLLPSGQWISGSNPGFSGTGYVYANTGTLRYCNFAPTLPVTGTYKVLMSWVHATNRASNANVIITHAGGTSVLAVNQRLDPDGAAAAGGWKELGNWVFNAGSTVAVRIDNASADGLVIADAVRFEPTGGLVLPTTLSLAAHDSVTTEGSADPARLVFRREGLLTNPLTVPLSVTGTATPGTDCAAMPSSIIFPSGSAEAILNVSASTDSIAEDTETLTITIQPDPAYTVSAASAATVVLEDSRYDRWSFTAFTPVQQTDPLISAPTVDPDKDTLNNYAEFVFGTGPLTGNDPPPLTAQRDNDLIRLTVRRLAAAASVPVSIQSSTDLSIWSIATGASLTDTNESPDRQIRWETWTVPAPGSHQFFRLRL